MKHILMIIAKENFKDEEFIIPFNKFKDVNFDIDIASTRSGKCISTDGRIVLADFSFSHIYNSNKNYDAIVLIGGPGSADLVGNKDLEMLLHKHKNLIAAICYSPVILAKADLLKDKKATVWDKNKRQSPILKNYGVTYTGKDVEIDNNIITANGPASANKFADTIIENLIHQDHKIQ